MAKITTEEFKALTAKASAQYKAAKPKYQALAQTQIDIALKGSDADVIMLSGRAAVAKSKYAFDDIAIKATRYCNTLSEKHVAVLKKGLPHKTGLFYKHNRLTCIPDGFLL